MLSVPPSTENDYEFEEIPLGEEEEKEEKRKKRNKNFKNQIDENNRSINRNKNFKIPLRETTNTHQLNDLPDIPNIETKDHHHKHDDIQRVSFKMENIKDVENHLNDNVLINKLKVEQLIHIFLYLPLCDLILGPWHVCRRWRIICKDADDDLYAKHLTLTSHKLHRTNIRPPVVRELSPYGLQRLEAFQEERKFWDRYLGMCGLSKRKVLEMYFRVVVHPLTPDALEGKVKKSRQFKNMLSLRNDPKPISNKTGPSKFVILSCITLLILVPILIILLSIFLSVLADLPTLALSIGVALSVSYIVALIGILTIAYRRRQYFISRWRHYQTKKAALHSPHYRYGNNNNNRNNNNRIYNYNYNNNNNNCQYYSNERRSSYPFVINTTSSLSTKRKRNYSQRDKNQDGSSSIIVDPSPSFHLDNNNNNNNNIENDQRNTKSIAKKEDENDILKEKEKEDINLDENDSNIDWFDPMLADFQFQFHRDLLIVPCHSNDECPMASIWSHPHPRWEVTRREHNLMLKESCIDVNFDVLIDIYRKLGLPKIWRAKPV